MGTNSTATTSFGVSGRNGHDASAFYALRPAPVISDDAHINTVGDLGDGCVLGDSADMAMLPDACVALVITSPPYLVGKDYEVEATSGSVVGLPGSHSAHLVMLEAVFTECVRVLEPGGRIAINVANLGRKPYRSLANDVTRICEELGLLNRGEVIWRKAAGAGGSCAFGSWRSPRNPTLRDTTERVLLFSKGRFDRALTPAQRQDAGLPHRNRITADEFLAATIDVWDIPPASAKRVGHPAPFPVDLPARLIDLFTWEEDIVLDPFMGSGSTLVAAKQSGRRFVGFDTDPEYVNLARSRLADTAFAAPVPLVPMFKSLKAGAEEVLDDTGFVIDRVKPRLDGCEFTWIVSTDKNPDPVWVLTAGGGTIVTPGLQNPDTFWQTMGRIGVFNAAHTAGRVPTESRLLVLTAAMPNKGNQRALNAVLGDCVDVVLVADSCRLASLSQDWATPCRN